MPQNICVKRRRAHTGSVQSCNITRLIAKELTTDPKNEPCVPKCRGSCLTHAVPNEYITSYSSIDIIFPAK